MPEQLKPAELVSRYRFVLSAFGLQYVRTQIYIPGAPLDGKEEQSSYTVQHTDKGKPNMHTGYSRGQGLMPIKTGQQAISPLGTPVWSDVILHQQEKTEGEGVQLIWCLLGVQQSKNIVKTAIQGRNGTVKEYISDGDYQVTLRGAIARTFKSQYPLEEMRQFLQLLKDNRSLKVVSPFLLQFDIHELVVESYNMAQQEGKQNMQRFEINCLSDDPLLLKDIKDNAIS